MGNKSVRDARGDIVLRRVVSTRTVAGGGGVGRARGETLRHGQHNNDRFDETTLTRARTWTGRDDCWGKKTARLVR